MHNIYKILALLILVVFIAFSRDFLVALQRSESESNKSIVVTTSMLESAALEVIPASQKIDVVRLLPPLSCPGHFDLSPRFVPILRSAVMVLRHDYQDILEEKIVHMGVEDILTLKISTTGSPLIPSHYYTLVKQIGFELSEKYPSHSQEIAHAEKQVKQKTDKLTEKIKRQAQEWNGIPVIAAVHVKEFCEWLGFEIAGVIERPEDTTPQDFEHLMSVKADMVVANLQEGMKGALSLGEKLGLPVVVLSNFPGADGYGENYYQLAEENIKRLNEAWLMR